MPIDGIAMTTIMIQTNSSLMSRLEHVVTNLREIDGVKDIRIIANN